MRILVVVDMQNDFISGVLGNDDTVNVVPYVVNKVKTDKNDLIIFTKDVHDEHYLDTMEGKKLPIPHCIRNTKGAEIIDELKPFTGDGNAIFEKDTFGSRDLLRELEMYRCGSQDKNLEIEFVGVCTDICVISNVLLVKAAVPNARIIVDADGCAGATRESHLNALRAMEACHIEIKGGRK